MSHKNPGFIRVRESEVGNKLGIKRLLSFVYHPAVIMQQAPRAVARLLRDLKEINENQRAIPDIRAEPLEKNLFVWHANIKAPEYCV